MMENLFNVLCSSLMATVNRDRFLRGEGPQLMNLMLREKKMSRNGSLKVSSRLKFIFNLFLNIDKQQCYISGIRSRHEWPRWKR